ncbi:hypothetical protein PLICRDRAFT_34839 [Plicaturopsis crispa FD-325 SS-3]|nr:hypothetical protein PLICRDRAFT_34839 [Plicaturopsis crispa FD-325 SS-3]
MDAATAATEHSASDCAKISAYYSLVFPNFTYYLQTLGCTIGRRCLPTSSQPSSSADTAPVDVDLGSLKSVSRLHARIEYEEDDERFVLVVIGRNGAWVDGVWSGSGSKVPLSERSQIQIASRTFQFVLPPPAPIPEDSPSPSSRSSSANRPRSPSVDVTSISPPSPLTSHSPPPSLSKASPTPITAAKTKPAASASKKRKKPEPQPRPRPEVMPPKPPLTYAQLCYRAIKALGGKATLQDICQWMMETFDWYHFNEGAGWENSVRHNLSSGRAFKKMERCAGERGKGFFWSVDESFEQAFEEQEAKAAATPVPKVKKEKKGSSVLEPALKRSVRDLKGGALPPPMTTVPLAARLPVVKSEPGPSSLSPPPPPLPLPPPAMPAATAAPAPPAPAPAPTPAPPSTLDTSPATSAISNLPPDVHLPLVIGPVPPSHPLARLPATDPLFPLLSAPPIVLHANTLILNPAVFSRLSEAQLRELESLGTRKTLEILQGYIKGFIKEVRRGAGGAAGRGRGRPRRGRGGKSVAPAPSPAPSSSTTPGGWVSGPPPTASPFTNAPLPPRPYPTPDPAQNQHAMQSPATSYGTAPSVPTPAPTTAYSAPSVAIPTSGVRAVSPILIIDDADEEDEGPVAKRRRLQSPGPASLLTAS